MHLRYYRAWWHPTSRPLCRIPNRVLDLRGTMPQSLLACWLGTRAVRKPLRADPIITMAQSPRKPSSRFATRTGSKERPQRQSADELLAMRQQNRAKGRDLKIWLRSRRTQVSANPRQKAVIRKATRIKGGRSGFTTGFCIKPHYPAARSIQFLS